jgi:hypothetical protein
MSCGPRAGFAELEIPENDPGSSIMPGKVNPTQCEALTMIAVQVMANDVAVGFGGAGGYREMNIYKPLMIYSITHSITIMTDGYTNFRKFLIEGTKPNLKKITEYVDRIVDAGHSAVARRRSPKDGEARLGSWRDENRRILKSVINCERGERDDDQQARDRSAAGSFAQQANGLHGGRKAVARHRRPGS